MTWICISVKDSLGEQIPLLDAPWGGRPVRLAGCMIGRAAIVHTGSGIMVGLLILGVLVAGENAFELTEPINEG